MEKSARPRRRQHVSPMLGLTEFAATCFLFFLADKDGAGNPWTPSWQVQAQSTAQRRRSSRQRPPSLHNQNHESAVRNFVQPKFAPNANPLTPGNHTSNVAIIVSSSRYWFNYRHVTNALSIYHLLKRGGMTDDNIVLMLADDIPCNMRNPFRGKIFPRGANKEDLMQNTEIDYSGTDVTVDAFLRVLLGRHLPGEDGGMGSNSRSWPKINENTNVLVYLTGHGGDNFFKFQDGEELMSHDIASAFSQMYELKRYNEILFISDTCQAFTMADQIQVPNVFSVGSSLKDQNSYASHSDGEVGQSVIDRYSKVIKDFVDDAVTLTSGSPYPKNDAAKNGLTFDESTLSVMERLNLLDILVRIPMNHGELGPNSKVGHTDHLCSRRMNQVPLSDFFAAPTLADGELGRSAQRSAKATLWMNDSPMAVAESIVKEECVIGEAAGAFERDVDEPNKTNSQIEPQMKHRGLSPTDPKFIVMAGGFLLLINLSSRIW